MVFMSECIRRHTITLIHADRDLIKRYTRNNPPDTIISWLYLGKNVLLCEDITKILGGMYHRIMIGEELQNTARNCRQEFIDYVGKMNDAHAKEDPCWWLTSVSEKNPYVSDLFLNFCYLHVGIKYIKESSQDLIIICESPALMRSIYKNCIEEEGIELQLFINPMTERLERVKSRFHSVTQSSWFIIRYTLRIIGSRLFILLRNKQATYKDHLSYVLIHSWTDKRSFQDDFKYSDIYTGDLGERIKERDIPVVYLANVLPTFSYHKAMSKLLKSKDDAFLFEEFIGLSDILIALLITRRGSAQSKMEIYPLTNLDVTDIVSAEMKRDHCNTRSKQAYLTYRASRQIGKKLDIQAFIYPFENHIWEKMTCLGLRHSSPKTRIGGYAHSVVIPMYTAYSLSKYEKEIIPLPDRIVVNGKRAHDLLIQSGFNEEMIYLGGALRYADTLRSVDTIRERQTQKENVTIIVTPTSGINETVELVRKVIDAFAEKSKLNIIIKPHPITPLSKLRSHLPELPSHFSIDERPVTELLQISDILIYTETTVSIEALAQGIPVLHIASDLRIDMNPLEGYECIPSVSTPEDIKWCVKRLLQTKNERQELYPAIAHDFFEDIHEDIIEIIIGKKKKENYE